MIQVDQSNKIERLEKATILAFSNGLQRAILIPSSVKRDTLSILKQQGKSRKTACLWMFSTGVYLLFKPYLAEIIKRNELIVIDKEYIGHEANIKSMILRHFWNEGFSFRADMINFALIGKASNAHKLAYNVQLGKAATDHKVHQKEFLALM